MHQMLDALHPPQAGSQEHGIAPSKMVADAIILVGIDTDAREGLKVLLPDGSVKGHLGGKGDISE